MIQKINKTNAAFLKGVYFEDINALVSSKDEAYLVRSFYFFYFSTLEAAKEKSTSLNLSTDVYE